MKVPINQKYMLTITEAAEYFGMGTKVLRKFFRNTMNYPEILRKTD